MILLLGGTGYVGQAFASYLKGRGVPFLAPTRKEADYTQAAVLDRLIREHRPEFLVNTAGYTGKPNVDACERDKAATLEGNTVFPLRVGETCAAHGLAWGHVSSGCIYQGAKGTDANGQPIGFTEDDPANFSFRSGNCSFYSGTKALAEEHLVGGSPVYIWRLRVPFDHRDGARNYISKLLRYKRLLEVRNSLSHLEDFIAACWATFERKLPTGIYNVTNHGSVTTREVVEMIRAEGARRRAAGDVASAARMEKEFSFFESEAEFMKIAAVAPRSSCVLDTSKAAQHGLPLRPVREALADSLRRWVWEEGA